MFGQPVRLEAGRGPRPLDRADGRLDAAHHRHGRGRGLRPRGDPGADEARALEVLTERTAHYAAALGAPMPKVAVTDAKSRWGSCKPGPRGDAGGDPLFLAPGAGARSRWPTTWPPTSAPTCWS